MFCTSCGKEVADGSLFCTSCGSKLASAVQPKTGANAQEEAVETVSPEVSELPVNQEINQAGQAPAASTIVTNAVPSQIKPVAPSTPVVSVSTAAPAKKSNRTVVYAFGAIVVVVLLVLLFGKGSGGYSDYKTLVKDYYNAINKKDVNGVIKLFDKDIQKELKDYRDDIKDTLDETKTAWDDEYDSGWNKQVKVASREVNPDSTKSHYIVYVEIDGESFDTLYIKKADNKYYLDEENSLFY